MNRKNKIIVSVVGIVVVLLALLGLTYAYYLTRIQGNTNTNSISVTTADLRLVYRDGSPNVVETEIEPSDEVYEKIFTVTNEGNVNIDYGVYLIDVINTFERKDDIKYKMSCTTDGTLPCNQITSDTTFPSGISELVTATIEPTKTHTYTFSFTYKDTGTDQSVDMGKVLQAKIQIFTENNNGLIIPFETNTLAYNLISSTGLESSATKYSVNSLTKIGDVTSTVSTGEYAPLPLTSLSGAYYCDVENCYELMQQGGGTSFTSCDESIHKGKYLATWFHSKNFGEILGCDGKYPLVNQEVFEDEQILMTTEDNYGTTYVYRGAVKENFVNFAEMCWRIVRIQGDGSIKLILEDQTNTCENSEGIWENGNWAISEGNFGKDKYIISSPGNYNDGFNTYYVNYLNPSYESDNSMATAFKTFQNGFTELELSKLKYGDWCVNDMVYDTTNSKYYTQNEILEMVKAGKSFTFASTGEMLKCNATIMNYWNDSTPMYVGTLTANEVIYAGNSSVGLPGGSINYYLNDMEGSFMTLTLSQFSDTYGAGKYHALTNNISHFSASNNDNFRPSIILKNGIEFNVKDKTNILGNPGTKLNPFVVE